MPNFVSPVGLVINDITVTPTIDTAIYAANDQLGSLMTFPGLLGPGKSGRLVINTLLDKAAQSSLITLFLFSAQPTIASADNAALNIADAEMEKCCAAILFTAANYVTTSANSLISVAGTAAILHTPYLYSNDSTGTIWAIMKSGGTPTYASASALMLTLGVELNPSIV